eukprot:CAMPEP_0201119984 /NCGR_PEP_ID=MMETSP0850-20130426/4077_1 /ASSEMBLY_ACC=CAM_ASM_000622 /TAXON_ID=183588 /ORGANISM="Pseudo-nitzschia fraudulenta, Strain WWA7" /LENGTH=59 /DNA_ID=CAMNT_0047385919 /DNA_START=146 /DNA_END=325 /DNA_ORIENTATION=+
MPPFATHQREGPLGFQSTRAAMVCVVLCETDATTNAAGRRVSKEPVADYRAEQCSQSKW